jgi:outer membrane protein assembly factor BamB
MPRGLVAILWVVITLSTAVRAADQPQWGQRYTRSMVSDEKDLPDGFDPDTGKNVKWKVPLGSETYGSPIVARGRILIGTNNSRPRDPRHKGDRGILLCLDEKDGSLCWQLVVPKREGDVYEDWPSAGLCSPATVEGNRVYTVSNRGEVMCLDLDGQTNGNDGPYLDEGKHMAPRGGPPMEVSKLDADILWMLDMPAKVGIHPHDTAHSSILLHGDLLYLNTGNGVDNTHRRIRSPDAPSLIVLDKNTGRLVAQDDERIGPRIFHCTWSSPALGEVNGRTLIFYGGGDGVVYAFEPLKSAPTEGTSKLKKVWWFDCDPNSPKANVHQWVGNRRESPSVISAMPVFHKQRVYVAGGGDVWWGKRQGWVKCIDATKTGDVTGAAEVWSYAMKQTSSTPAVYNGLVFAADCAGVVHCLDAETGKPYWTHQLSGEIWGSPLAADGKVYIGTMRRDFCVLAADKEKRVLNSIKLDAAISSTPTAANGVLYLATMTHLYALQKPKQ